MHQVNYDEPDHDEMVAEDQRDCLMSTQEPETDDEGYNDRAAKGPHVESNKGDAPLGDDGKRQKTELSVTRSIQYPIDEPLLRKHAASSAANIVNKHKDANPNSETVRVIIEQFLRNTTNGNCNVEYDHREIGTALIANGHITHARIYSRKPYRNDAFELPSHLRAYALSSLYYDLDDSKCFHRIIIGKSNNEEACKIANELLYTKEGQKHPEIFKEIADYYDKPIKHVKDWFHALGNDQTVQNWKLGAGIPADFPDHHFIAKYVDAEKTLTDELADNHPEAIKFIQDNYPTKERKDDNGKVIKVKRNAKTTWKAFYCQQFEAISRDVKIKYCKEKCIPYGPARNMTALRFRRRTLTAGPLTRTRSRKSSHKQCQMNLDSIW
jgi:hypothetical protein